VAERVVAMIGDYTFVMPTYLFCGSS